MKAAEETKKLELSQSPNTSIDHLVKLTLALNFESQTEIVR